MAANTPNKVMSPQAAALMSADLVTTAACTTRGPTATAGLAAANIIAFTTPVPAITTDFKISKVSLKGIATAMTGNVVACIIGLWDHDGTTARLKKEIVVVPPTAPSATLASYESETLFDDFVLPAQHTLYASTSVTLTAAASALGVTAHGATL